MVEKITSARIQKARQGALAPGRYWDQGGLLLQVSKHGASWLLRFKINGKTREMGLGSVTDIGLSKARDLATKHRGGIKGDKVDPLAKRDAAKAEQLEKQRQTITFNKAARAYIEAHEPSWKNPKHRQQWRNTLATYVSPLIGNKPMPEITTAHVLEIIEPIWTIKPETASRVRGRIEMILDYAKAKNWRDGENPARWRGLISHALPSKTKVRKVKHHAAVPLNQLPTVFAKLGKSKGIAAAADQFAILCASRPSEVAEALWPEIDRATATWTVPPVRMGKNGIEHRVALSAEALAILDRMKALRVDDDPRVFPGAKIDRPLSLTSMAKALAAAGGGVATMHGTARNCFDDWATGAGYSTVWIDRALSHVEGDPTRAAYRRADLLDQRRPMMAVWATYCRTGK